jgi:peptide/nickel transport system substrate-binding protein
MKRKLLLTFVAALILCALSPAVFASGGSERQKDDLVIAVATEPVHYVSLTEAPTSDFDQVISFAVQDTLLKKNWATGAIEPYLCESYEISKDGLQIKVKLRPNVYFHDGTKLTSEDFKFTYDQAKKYQIGNILLVNYDSTEVIDDQNFVIHMAHAWKPILNALCSRVSPVVSKAYWEKVGAAAYDKHPIGTGPYKFVSAIPGNQIVLERNDKYWGQKPYFKRIIIKTILDVNTQIMAVQSGDVDVVIGPPIDSLQKINNPKVVWDATPANTTAELWFNMQDTRWVAHDVNFRKAVQYGINKDAINQAIYNGKATMIDIYGAPGFTGRPAAGTYTSYAYDPAKAKEYLAKSNYKGQEFKVVTWAGNVTEKICQVIQGSLQEVGINMKVVATDTATYYDTVRNTGDFDAQYWTTGSSITDMDSIGNTFLISRYDFKNNNLPRGKEMNDLSLAGRTEPDDSKRLDVYAKAMTINNEDVYQIYTHMDLNTILYRKGLQGIKADMVKYYRYQEWSR